MKQGWKKVVVAVAIACMMLSGIPGTAMAADVTYDSTATAFTKYWEVASDQQYDSTQTFTFTRTFVTYSGSNYSDTSYTSSDDLSDTDFATVATEKTDITTDSWTVSSTSSTTYYDVVTYGDVLGDLTFPEPGIYTFSIEENDSGNYNVVDDSDTSYYLVVNVQWADASNPGGSTAIASAYMTTDTDDSTAKTTSASFTNSAQTTSNVTVKNTVTGTAANTSDEFTFTLSLSADTTGSYAVVDADGNSLGTVSSAASLEVTLSNGEVAIIQNLPVGATYYVTESGNDYDSSSYVVSDSNNSSIETGETTASDTALATSKLTVDAYDDTITFTNTKGFTAATGITANTLPFVIIGAIVVAGVVVLLVKRRRRSYEEF